MALPPLQLLTPSVGLLALAFAGYLTLKILKEDTGNQRMREIAAMIREGSMAYLLRQYKTIVVFMAVVVVILVLKINYRTAAAFVVGALCSILAGFVGMNIAVRSNVRTTNAAQKSGLNKALDIAFSGGAVMGLSVVGLGLIGISSLYILYGDAGLSDIVGFGFGASSIALFCRVGGGIYTKAADIGADLVGKIEAGIPEDDPRNPAVIADNVGDNVGDCAGMGADLFESYASSIIAAMVIGIVAYGPKAVLYSLLVGAAGTLASLIGVFFVKSKDSNPQNALNKGTGVACLLSAVSIYLLSKYFLNDLGVFYAALAGLLAGVFIGIAAEYYTSYDRKPTQEVAKAAQSGPAIIVIKGFAVGLESTAVPVLVVCAALILAFKFAGLFGIAIAGLGMLSITGIVVAADSYGPISDNAGGIAQMSGLDSKVREITDQLDSVGNTTKALCKGFAIGSAALTALALLSAFSQEARLGMISVIDPLVLSGLFIGGMLPFLFSALCMDAVAKTAFDIVGEVRRQFKEIPGLMEGNSKPDYARCVDISTKSALNRLIVPGLMAVVIPILVGLILGAKALAGLLAGSTVTGLMLALFMANAGGTWDNAKKYIEKGNFGGKGTAAHAAAVVGDTLGDPFKDTAGPSLNILIKLMSIVSLVFIPLFI